LTHAESLAYATIVLPMRWCRHGLHPWIPENLCLLRPGRNSDRSTPHLTCRLCRDAASKKWKTLVSYCRRHKRRDQCQRSTAS
jgi:hypothetical protein